MKPGFQVVWANNYDGTRFVLFVRSSSFDVELWAQSRLEAFRILGIVSLTIEEIAV